MDLPDFSLYTLAELSDLVDAAKVALANKTTIDLAGHKIDSILSEVKTAQGTHKGDSWERPHGVHDAYPLGARVSHGGKLWDNLTTANVWEPGISGWREFVDPGSVADWIQPTGSHDIYNLGDRVLYNGVIWESDIAANVWEPGVSGWRQVVTGETTPLWVQPTGAHDAYPLGTQVTYNGSAWVSIVDENVWAPGVYGWDAVEGKK